MNREEFYLEDQLRGPLKEMEDSHFYRPFYETCSAAQEAFQKQWEESGEFMEELLDIQKKAIMGYPREVDYFLNRIRAFAKEEGKEKTILFNWSGHGLMDLLGYDNYMQGKLVDVDPTDAEIQSGLKALEGLPKPAGV